MLDFSTLLFLDCKPTIWETDKPPQGQVSEIVRIDLCTVDTEKNSIKEAEIIYIAPAKSKVSAHCKQLFNLDVEKIDKGSSFQEAYRHLRIHHMLRDRIYGSWGAAEKAILGTDCKAYDLEPLLIKPNFDVQYNYALMTGTKLPHLSEARKALDIAYVENDAVNIAQVYLRIAGGLRNQSKSRILYRAN